MRYSVKAFWAVVPAMVAAATASANLFGPGLIADFESDARRDSAWLWQVLPKVGAPVAREAVASTSGTDVGAGVDADSATEARVRGSASRSQESIADPLVEAASTAEAAAARAASTTTAREKFSTRMAVRNDLEADLAEETKAALDALNRSFDDPSAGLSEPEVPEIRLDGPDRSATETPGDNAEAGPDAEAAVD